MTHIIFLHGASSSGKTTLARALQAEIELPFWHISIDHLRDSGVLPTQRFDSGDFVWTDSRKAFFDGFHASLAAYATAGNNLILEHILDTPGWAEDLHRHFAPHDVLFVALHCPLELLIEREETRKDRPAGSAEHDFHTIHRGRRYDLELHSEDGTDTNVGKVLDAWRSERRTSEFSATGSGKG